MSKNFKIYTILNSPVKIPTSDIEAWNFNPKYRFLYNKIFICDFQDIENAPMPIEPTKYPVIIKPIINLCGMGLNVKLLKNSKDFNDNYHTSNFWMECFDGEHKSYDLIIENGVIKFSTCFRGEKTSGKTGLFDYWESIFNYSIPTIINKLVEQKLCDYTGCLNIETIEGNIIECHTRMGDIDLFPTHDILKGIISLYKKEYYCWDNIVLNSIIYFPIWIKICDKATIIYNFVKEVVIKKFINNKQIIEIGYETDMLANTNEYCRIMYFTCENKDRGLSIKRKIIHFISKKFDIVLI